MQFDRTYYRPSLRDKAANTHIARTRRNRLRRRLCVAGTLALYAAALACFAIGTAIMQYDTPRTGLAIALCGLFCLAYIAAAPKR